MKAYIKGSGNIVNVTFNEKLGLFVDDDNPYIKYVNGDIELVVDKETPRFVDKAKRDDMVNDIMTNFDFHKVHKVMKALDWTYYCSQGVPTIDELRQTALTCLNEIKYKDIHSHCATGGFCAHFEECDGGIMTLEFNLTECSAYYNDF